MCSSNSRIKRHVAVTTFVAKQMRNKYCVNVEPFIAIKDGWRKPDIIALQAHTVIIFDRSDLDAAHSSKYIKYSQNTVDLKNAL